MAQRVTLRKRQPYNTTSNRRRVVKTPGGKLVVHHLKKKAVSIIDYLGGVEVLRYGYRCRVGGIMVGWMDWLGLLDTFLYESRGIEIGSGIDEGVTETRFWKLEQKGNDGPEMEWLHLYRTVLTISLPPSVVTVDSTYPVSQLSDPENVSLLALNQDVLYSMEQTRLHASLGC
jgi:hypothetical protein